MSSFMHVKVFCNIHVAGETIEIIKIFNPHFLCDKRGEMGYFLKFLVGLSFQMFFKPMHESKGNIIFQPFSTLYLNSGGGGDTIVWV